MGFRVVQRCCYCMFRVEIIALWHVLSSILALDAAIAQHGAQHGNVIILIAIQTANGL